MVRISKKSNPRLVAITLLSTLKKEGFVEIETVGADATYNAVKAMATVGELISDTTLICEPQFAQFEGFGGQPLMGIHWTVKLISQGGGRG